MPTGVAFADLPQHVAGENVQTLFPIVVQIFNAASIQEVTVELTQFIRDRNVLRCHQIAGLFQRIDVKLEVVLEEPSEGLENAAA